MRTTFRHLLVIVVIECLIVFYNIVCGITVTRGVCVGNEEGFIVEVIESRDIAIKYGVALTSTLESAGIISSESIVSINMWASDSDFLVCLEERLISFLSDKSLDPMKSEFLIPVLIDKLIKKNQASVKILPTDEKWIGITYQEDTEMARAEFRRMRDEGVYPERLWG